MMKTIKCEVEFLTPAFLGNASQSGQWRTPPFKALLRQWWRVAWAARKEFSVDVAEMRKEEGELFGHASPDGKSSRSQVLLRLENWSKGELTNQKWASEGGRRHGTMRTSNSPAGGRGFDPLFYAGYGVLKNAGQMVQERVPAINCGESNDLQIAVPESAFHDVNSALSLIRLYGALGGRSRNGWGSVDVKGPCDATSLSVSRLWREALDLDWPHAIGEDEKGSLIWKIGEFAGWRELIEEFGHLRKTIRKVIKAPDRGTRLPNTIRFKARRAESGNQLSGFVFHIPCKPPPGIRDRTRDEDWEKIHSELDRKLSRSDQ